jgi:hypothetical protein
VAAVMGAAVACASSCSAKSGHKEGGLWPLRHKCPHCAKKAPASEHGRKGRKGGRTEGDGKEGRAGREEGEGRT